MSGSVVRSEVVGDGAGIDETMMELVRRDMSPSDMTQPDLTRAALISMHTSPLAQPGAGDSGGMNVYVRELAGSLARAGVDTRVYVRADALCGPGRRMVEPGLEVIHLSVGPIDVAKEALPGLIDGFADAVGADIESIGGVSVLHANYWLSGVAAHRLKHDLALPLVSTFHTLARVKDRLGDHEPGNRAEAEAQVIGCSDIICASNPVEAADLVELYNAPAERIELVPPGVDRAFFSPGDRRGARRAIDLDDGPVALFVGRIQPLKGLQVAVGALGASRHRDALLLVVGGPSGAEGAREFDQVMSRIDELGLGDRARFVQPQPHHALSTYYRAADVCLVPSRSESFGLVALEAAACGTPVIATAVGGLPTLVEHGRTGLLVPDRDPAHWTAALDEFLDRPELRESMGVAGAALAGRFNWSTTAARLRRLYGDLALSRELVACS